MEKSVQKKYFFLLFSGVILFSTFSHAFYHELKYYPQKVWDFDFKGEYFSTDSNYSSSGGVYNALPAGNYYRSYDFNFSARTTIPKKNWALYADSQLSAAESKGSSGTRTNSGITHLRVGTDYIMYEDSFALIPDFSFLYPFTKNEFNGDSVAINEGAIELSARLLAQTKLKYFKLGGFAGVTYRDSGRSSLIPYGAILEMQLTKWTFGGNLQGYTSANYDSDSANSGSRDAWFLRTNGGSKKNAAVNPMLMESNLWAQVRTTKNLNFMFGLGFTLNGANTSNSWNIMGGLSYRLPIEETNPDPNNLLPDTPPKKVKKSDLDRFEEETTDGVDQTLFELSPTTEIKNEPLLEEAPPKNNPKNLQNELDKTEMQIELKSIKKKKK